MIFLIFLSKMVLFFSRVFRLGSGSTWPGHMTLRIDPEIIEKIIDLNKDLKIIVVAGTNGKTTTTSLIKHALNKLGYKVFSNSEGANLINGIASAFLKNSNLAGWLDYDYAVLESDEFTLPLLLKKVTPRVVFILNLFRDQLDRYGEVNTIALKWQNCLKALPKETLIILNGDDPQLYFIGKNLRQKKEFFGVKNDLMKIKKIPHDVDFNYCPSCFSLLDYKSISYAHLGDFICKKCGFTRSSVNDFAEDMINYPLEGLYNIYNTNSVYLFIKKLFKVKAQRFNQLMKDFQPSFGRQEEIIYKKRKVFLLLSKNPAGFNQSIKTVINILKGQKANFLISLNDRIPDGQDVSWIWDVDFRPILEKAKSVFVSGDRLYDMVLRLEYESAKKNLIPIENLKMAVESSISRLDAKEKLFVLTTYSAMLEVRKILVGRKLL
ncbi:DUF1727 domain-containing protein [Candidatus Roizmanbacteria bacterium]|nr:DUF1727 domain-containing protein [Candidatus Roizmanbacteria bacterium]